MKGNKDKTKFRQTTLWKNWRKKLIQERGCYCECCGKKTKNLQCHHKDESVENYQILEPERFSLLCSQCHKCVESLAQIKPENWYKIRRKEWVELYKPFLIIGERNIEKNTIET